MQTEITARKALYSFDSLLEISQHIEGTPRVWRIQQSKSARARDTWDLGLGYDGALKLAREGWLEGAQRAQEALRAFAPKSPAPDTKVDFYGHMPHVPRYCAGAPDSMLRHTTPPTIGGGRVITLYVAINANCNQRADTMANYGLGVAQYINQLESQGMRVELYACVAQDTSGGAISRVAHSWRLKGADQPLDLAVIVFAIGHPAMYRRIWFAMIERSAAKECMSYHYPERVKPSDIINFPTHAYILNGMLDANKQAPTPQKALENVGAEIDKAIEQLEGVI